MFFTCCYISACFQGKIWLIHDSCPFFHHKPLFRLSHRTRRRTALPVIFVTVHSVPSNYFPAAQSPLITFILLKKQEIFQIGFRHICRLIMEPPERCYHHFPASLITDNRIAGRMIYLRRTDMFHAVKIILKDIGFPVRHVLLCNMKTNSASYLMFNHKFHFLSPAPLLLLRPQLPVPLLRSRGLR